MDNIHTIGWYSGKKNEITSLAGKWMELEIIMLREISQTQKDKHWVFSQEYRPTDQGRKEKNRGDEPIQVILYVLYVYIYIIYIHTYIHTYMKMSQGKSVCSYLKQAKISSFFFFFYISRIGGWTGPVWEIGTSGGGEKAVGIGCRRMTMVLILYTHVYKWKSDTCWNCSKNGEIRESDGGDAFNYDIL
jgi:hypothetical protein